MRSKGVGATVVRHDNRGTIWISVRTDAEILSGPRIDSWKSRPEWVIAPAVNKCPKDPAKTELGAAGGGVIVLIGPMASTARPKCRPT
jgi:hypothetical protein